MSDFDYEAYERECEQIREENETYLVEFEKDLVDKGLTDKTIRRHISNVDFYINTYLVREDAQRMPRGCYTTDDFLGYFFIRKCMWSTPTTIKQNAASFKKFYKCMLEHGHIDQSDYDMLLDEIKEGMPLWIADCEEFNDPDNSLFESDEEQALFNNIRLSLLESFGLGDLFGDINPQSEGDPDDEGEPLTHEEAIEFLTLALFYLTSWEEHVGGKEGTVVRRAWKSADWGALDRLQDQGFISFTNKAKSVYITDSGINEAYEVLNALGLGYLVQEHSI